LPVFNAPACPYCTSANQPGAKNCRACGAPLPEKQETAVPARSAGTGSAAEVSALPVPESIDTVELGRKVEEGSRAALQWYGAFWRALADAAVIAMVSFGTGAIGAAAGIAWAGLALSPVFGLAVGFSRKSYLFTLLSAPLGFAAGSIVGGVLWAAGLGPAPMVFCVSLGAASAALLGSRPMPFRRRNFWEKARPPLGAAGAVVFGLLGTAAGAGLRAAVTALGWL